MNIESAVSKHHTTAFEQIYILTSKAGSDLELCPQQMTHVLTSFPLSQALFSTNKVVRSAMRDVAGAAAILIV